MSGDRIGVIDIGSNSVRLVIYDGLKRLPLPLYNEKAMCQLGKGLALTGALNPEGKKLACAALERFARLRQIMGIETLHVLATAAMRDAEDGVRFVQKIEKDYGFKVKLVPGKEEARLAGQGILSSMYAPSGVAGDLGGGSLELVSIKKETIAKQVTLPLGLFRVTDGGNGDVHAMRKLVGKSIAEQTWLRDMRAQNFYAIGGSLRALAKIHMERTHYPLGVLHGYCVPAKEMKGLIAEILHMPPAAIASLPGCSAKRAYEIMPASTVLEAILHETGCERVIFSASGIREGFLFDLLQTPKQQEDALIAGCADFTKSQGQSITYARELFTWMSPLFAKETEPQRRLREASCLLSEVSWRTHPEYRPAEAFHSVLHSELTGIDHRERIMLALAAYHRHRFKVKERWPVLTLATEKDRAWAKAVGSAANLAFHVAGGVKGALLQTELKPGKSSVELTLPDGFQPLYGDTLKKRLDGLGESLREISSLAK